MPAPGVKVTSSATRALRGAPTDTSVLFVAGPVSAGTTGQAVRITSMADYPTAGLGTRTGAATAVYDALEVFFNEGGAVAYVSRTVTSGTVVTVTDALGAFTAGLGPGQVIAPGDETSGTHSALLAHAAANNRVALLNGGGSVVIGPVAGGSTSRNVSPDAAAAGLIARGDAARSVNEAPAGDRGYLRSAVDVVRPATVAAVTALAATAAGSTGSEFGAIFTAGRFTDTERATLDEAEVNPFVIGLNGVQLYGYNGLVNDSFFTNARLRMSLTARLRALGEQFVFRTINDDTRDAFEGVMRAELQREFAAGQLYGDTADEAFGVEVPDDPTAAAAGRLYGTAWYVPGPFAERVEINLMALPVPAATAV